MLTVCCPADKYESSISPPLPKPALTKEEVEELSHSIIKEYIYSSNLKVHADTRLLTREALADLMCCFVRLFSSSWNLHATKFNLSSPCRGRSSV